MLLRALLAFLLLPGLVAILAPPLIASVDPWRGSIWMPGFVVMAVGATVLVWCVKDFYVSGKGSLAPWDPPKKLVVVGLYRYLRNPMYVGVLLLVVGWCVLLSSPMLAVYVFVLAIAFHIRVILHEEPSLESAFGDEWRSYRSAAPRWFPIRRR